MQEQQTPEVGKTPETKLQFFTNQQLTPKQLLQLKGGDGEDPPEEEIIGHEDVIDL